MRQRLRSRAKVRLRRLIAGELRQQLIAQPVETREAFYEAVLASPAIAAKSRPIEPFADPLVNRARPGDATLPLADRVPPESLWSITADYQASAERHVGAMCRALEEAGIVLDGLSAVLDFGCGTGRMLHGLHSRVGGDGAFWGVDQDAARIDWAQCNLSPPMSFVTCSTLPHLTFEDRMFDLVTAGSVFSHISEMADAWLLELLRVTKVGGHLYLTIQDEAYVAATKAREDEDWLTPVLADHWPLLDQLDEVGSIVIDRGHPDAMVFYDRTSLLARWSVFAEVVGVVENAYDAQTAVLLRKR